MARRVRSGPRLAPKVPLSAAGNGAGHATRERIITTAERLIAEAGIGVSVRQIGEAAGQANKSAVGYHFGTKADLVLAIARRHAPDIEQRRATMIDAVRDSDDLGDWLSCLVKPITDHLAALGSPSWYARFLAHAVTDPELRQVVYDDSLASPSMRTAIERATELLPVVPPEVLEERGDMTLQIIVHTCAARERALEAARRTPRATWDDACGGMVDALVGLWRAPVRRGVRSGHSNSHRGAT